MPLGALAALALLLCSLPAAAVVVDIDARDNTPATPVEVSLDAGAYTLVPVDVAGGGAYTATNFWDTVERCDETGGDCRYGWIWQYVFASDSLPETQVVADGRWATPELAFANAFETSFDLYEPETLRLYFIDNPYDDNLGGVSLDVVLVPEPGRAALVLVGALGLAASSLLSRPRAS
jgi:hypothetical protein